MQSKQDKVLKILLWVTYKETNESIKELEKKDGEFEVRVDCSWNGEPCSEDVELTLISNTSDLKKKSDPPVLTNHLDGETRKLKVLSQWWS